MHMLGCSFIIATLCVASGHNCYMTLSHSKWVISSCAASHEQYRPVAVKHTDPQIVMKPMFLCSHRYAAHMG